MQSGIVSGAVVLLWTDRGRLILCRYAWDQSTDGSCRPSQDLAAIYYADTAVNIAVDWFCAFL